jgi:hypothetical protein
MDNTTIIEHANTSRYSTASEWLNATAEFAASCNASEAFAFIESLKFPEGRIPRPLLCAVLQLAYGFAELFSVVESSSHAPVRLGYREVVGFVLTAIFSAKYPIKLRYLDEYIDFLSELRDDHIHQCDVAKELFLRGWI